MTGLDWNTKQMPKLETVRNKLKTIEELSEHAVQARARGQRVVLCHGVFDLLHMGHVRHLESARREGDILLVTLTADKFVHKGPGRPIFGEQIRAEMLAAIQYVDGVAINYNATSEPVLEVVKPDIYVKGSDYENPEDDISGNIVQEREIAEKFGGRLSFTRDVTYSSSTLINRHLNIYDPPLQDYLSRLRNESGLTSLLELIERVKDYRVLLVGDAIIDEYQYVAPLGKSPKENMIATLFESREIFAGGVFAAANHVASFCKEVEVLSVLGDDDDFHALVDESLKPNVKFKPLIRDNSPTTKKCRFVDNSMRKLFEVYSMNDRPVEPELRSRLEDVISERAGDFDLVIATDFGHGMITGSTPKLLASNAKFFAVNAQSNSANMGFNLVTRYPHADYICIDAPEARLAAGDKFAPLSDVAQSFLSNQLNCARIIITQGMNGCLTFEGGIGTRHIPVFTKTAIDTVGAGDAFLAVTSPLVAAGGSMEHVGFIGNAAGAMKVGIVGHRQSVEKVDLIKFVTALLK